MASCQSLASVYTHMWRRWLPVCSLVDGQTPRHGFESIKKLMAPATGLGCGDLSGTCVTCHALLTLATANPSCCGVLVSPLPSGIFVDFFKYQRCDKPIQDDHPG